MVRKSFHRVVYGSALVILGIFFAGPFVTRGEAIVIPSSRSKPFHLHLLRAEPKLNDTLTTAPTSVNLWFSEKPELAVTSIKVSGTDGAAVPTDAPHSGEARKGPEGAPSAVVRFNSALKPGKYTVAWQTMSKDGHPVRGQYSFVVATSQSK